MTTRRDLVELASALGLAGAVPSSAERVAAVQLLDREVPPRHVLDPCKFAGRVDGILGGALDNDWLGAINPTGHAAYAQAWEALGSAVSASGDAAMLRPYWGYEGVVFDFIMSAYYAGIRHGAAYENLRRSVVGELAQCEDCWGVGATDDRDVCTTCGGTGTVALGG
jgi:hypothetical protein